MHEQGLEAKARYAYDAPKTQPSARAATCTSPSPMQPRRPLVQVDLETGEVKVLKIIAAHDVGRAINPGRWRDRSRAGL